MATSYGALQNAVRDRAAAGPDELYPTIWRWHFYAGLFVAPFAIFLAVTGALYLFQSQIENWLYRDLFLVAPQAQSIAADAQVAAALAAFRGSKAEAYTPPLSATRSALVRIETPDSRELTVAVNPHSGKVLGAINERWRFNQVVFYLHGELLLGPVGQAMMELAASWAFVMLITGLYLWWPRNGNAIFGVLLPRLRASGRVLLRDLHAVTAVWVAALLIFLILTGLPWSLVSGALLNDLAANIGKGTPDNGLGFGAGGSTTVNSATLAEGWATTHAEHLAGPATSASGPRAKPLPLDQVVAIARHLDGVAPPYEIRLPVDAHGVFTVVTNPDDPAGTAFVHLDQYTGRIIRAIRWDDFGPLSKAISLGVSLHEGRYFGIANQLLGLCACLGLVGMVTAAIVMWWRRRPPGTLGVPDSKPQARIGGGVITAAVILGVLMPLLGASLIVILVFDILSRRRRRRRSLVGAVLCFASLAAVQSAKAQTATGTPADGTPQTSAGEVIVVTATRTPEDVTQVPASVSVVTQQQINATSAQELDDVLRMVPGIDLLGYSGEAQHPTSDSLGMRGLGGSAQGISRGLVMVDGVPINDPFFGYIEWGRVPLANIDRVEIVRGGGSPLWGNYAEGGVINIITREPAQRQFIFDGGGGSYGTYRTSVFGAYPFDTMKLQGFLESDGTNGFQQVPSDERAPFNVPTSHRTVNLNLRDTIAPSGDLVAHTTFHYTDYHQRLETLLDKNSQASYSASGDIKKSFANGGALAGTLFLSDNDFSTNNSTYFPIATDLNATTQSLNEIHKVAAKDVGGSLIWSQQFSGPIRSYMVGTDVHYITGADHTDHFIAPDFTPTFTKTIGHGDQTFVGAFVQAKVSPFEPLEIVGSGRLQWLDDTNGYDGSLGGIGVVPDRTHTSFDPRVDVRYALPAGFALRGAYYRSFRAPNIGDMFYTYAAGGFVMLPAPSLQPERLSGGEVGLDFTQPGLRSQFTLYRTNISNYIVGVPTTNPVYTPQGWFVVQNENIAAVEAQGFETEVDWDIGFGVTTTLAYTLADSVVKNNPTDPASVGQQIIDVPRNKVATGLTYQAKQGWRVSTQAFWVDRTDWASFDHTDPGYPGKIAADSHFLVDVSGSYPFNEHIEAYVQIQNLFNRHYIATSFSAPSAQVRGAPFTAFAGIRVTY